jgi:hypothetical protein
VGVLVARVLIVVLVVVTASCAQPAPAAAPTPTATTIVTAGSPCAPVIVAPVRFDAHVAIVPSPTPRPAFTGSHFAGLGKVTSLPSGGASVVVELVDPGLLLAFGPTTLKITSATSFDRSEFAWAVVASGGVAAGASDVPLGADAAAVEAGQHVVLECHRTGGPTAEGVAIALAAPAGSAAWKLSRPLTASWPAGTLVRYDRTVHVGSLTDLHLAVGESVVVEMDGTAGDYRATKLTNAGVTFGYKG